MGCQRAENIPIEPDLINISEGISSSVNQLILKYLTNIFVFLTRWPPILTELRTFFIWEDLYFEGISEMAFA